MGNLMSRELNFVQLCTSDSLNLNEAHISPSFSLPLSISHITCRHLSDVLLVLSFQQTDGFNGRFGFCVQQQKLPSQQRQGESDMRADKGSPAPRLIGSSAPFRGRANPQLLA